VWWHGRHARRLKIGPESGETKAVPPLARHCFSLTATAILIASPALARADEAWLLQAEADAALLLNQPARSFFGPGGSVAAGVYRSVGPHFLLGLRLRGAGFTDRESTDPSRADPGNGGLASASLAARWRPLAGAADASRAKGLWLELAGGGGLTGSNFHPTAEAGLGYGFAAGPVVLGPALRYLQIIQGSSGFTHEDAKIALLGIEVTWFDPQPQPPPPPPPAPPAPAPAPVDSDGDGLLDPDDRCPKEPEDKDGFEDEDGCPDKDNDHDGILDADDRCPSQPETVNGVEDQDGCPDEGLIELIDDRVVLEDRVLFETDQTRISSRGRRALTAVVTLWHQHPEWERLEVEGHADQRGTAEYNQTLSENRARKVQAMLVTLGAPAEKLTFRGFGATRPRTEARDPDSLQTNRRVELVVIRKVAPPGAQPPGAQPAGTQPTRPAPIEDPAPPKPTPNQGAGQ
jgi:outer membrane protein OmpA-like peptidoglycan-associated protein